MSQASVSHRIAQALVLSGSLLVAGLAHANILLNGIVFPSNIGRGQDVNVDVQWTRSNATASTFSVTIPPQLQIAPPAVPAGCTLASQILTCNVVAGAAASSGVTTFQVRGAVVGGFSLTASSTGSADASNSGNVTSGGDLTVVKTKTSPAGNPIVGQTTVFQLAPSLALADDVPAGASIVVTDNLPGTSADFNLTAVGFTGLTPSCNSIAAANVSPPHALVCTYTGPFTVAAFNASRISVTGTPGNFGGFTNVASIATGNVNYFDSNSANNIFNLNYTVDQGSDLQALGTFPASAVLLSSSQTLTLTYSNNGPLNSPSGGTVSTVIPATFTIGTLPPGCTRLPATGPGPWTITCAANVVNNGNSQSFAIPLTMPTTPVTGNFQVTVTPPAGFGDAVPGNNSVDVPYTVVVPVADLVASKGKSPGGPQPTGTVVTTTMTVANASTSASAASYSATQPLRIVDYLRPEEVGGGTVSAVSTDWSCAVTTGIVPPFGINAAQTTRVACQSTDVGSLAIGGSRSVSFSSTLTLGGSTAPIALPNTACTGGRALTALGLAVVAGPQPPDTASANDCANDSANLVVTPVVSGLAQASVQKLSSVDNAAFFDAVGSAPVLAADGTTIYWRLVITTPTMATNPGQTTIPTLRLSDTLPGRLNVSSSGSPAPGYVTPAISVTTTPNTFGVCPNLLAGNSDALNCSFSNVPAGTTITINMAVQRPLASGLLTNTAAISSPDAVLSAAAGGQLSDSAAVAVSPRLDAAVTTKTVVPTTPRIGELVQFTITAQNLGPDDVTAAGQFTIADTLNVTPTGLLVGYEVLSASGSGMNCAASNFATGAVSCTNTGAVARYTVQTIIISARVKKPSGVLPLSGNVYTNQTNVATVALTGGYCEFKTETVTNASVSSVCNDAASVSNNSRTVTFDVLVPAIDMKQRKERLLPSGQSAFGLGDQLHYRFRVQANGPSRAEGIVMTDRLVVPAGFFVELAGGTGFPRTVTASAINAAAAESGYTLDGGKAGAVTCIQSAANADILCRLSAVPASNFLDAAREVNFELFFNVTPTTATAPVSFGNRAFVCADETSAYESSGACSDVPATAGNNLASVNDTVFPKNDLEVVSKTTVTPSPVDINQPIRFDIVMRNNGTSAGVKMRLRDTLPTGLEWVNTGAQLPVASVNGGSAATLSGALSVSATVPADGTANVCFISNGITALSDLTQQQDITCDISGAFPAGAANTITLTLYARAKGGLYDSSASAPYLVGRTNSAVISPGKDSTGTDIAIDINAANDSKTSTVQIRNAQLGGRTFLDLNNNGDQNGTTLSSDQGLGNVTITMTGTDLYGYPVTRSVTTDSSALGAGSTRGDYLFTNLPPSNAAGYTITQTQPAGYGNGLPQANTVRTVRNGASAMTSGPFAVSNTTVPDTSVISGVRLAGGAVGVQFDFPELQKPSLSGFVYLDADNDGVKAGAEAGINGVTLTLIGCRAGPNGVIDTAAAIGAGPVTCAGDDVSVSLTAVTATDTTFGAGYYRFLLDEPGRYSVTEQVAQPLVAGAVTLRGKTTAGSVDLVTSATGSNDGGTRGTVNTTASSAGGAPGVLQEISATVPASQIRDVLISNSAALSVQNNFGETLPASLGGVVYTERGALNSNFGSGGDWPFPGVSVLLMGTDDLGRAVSVTGTTDGNGVYVFNNLRPGIYQVVKTNPGGIINEVGGAFPGRDAGNVTRGTRLDDNTINAITLVSGTVVINTNFAVTNGPAPAVPVVTATISGLVYIDRTRNNVLDGTDIGRIADVTIKLVQGTTCETGTVLQTTTTAADGTYSFFNVNVGGNYLVCQTQPVGYDNGNAKGVAGSNSIAVTNLAAIGSTDNDFGELPTIPAVLPGSISGTVYLDTNGNALRDGSDAGIPGVTVTLSGLDASGVAVTRTAVTDSLGNYRFESLAASGPEGYSVVEQVTQPNAPGTSTLTLNGATSPGTIASVTSGNATPVVSLPSAVRGIVLPSGGASIDNNFGELLPASVSGVVYVEKGILNSNYAAGTDVAFPGVSLRLTGIDDLGRSVSIAATTDLNGAYAFTNLRPGTYTVVKTVPPGITNEVGGAFPGKDAGNLTRGVRVDDNTVNSITLAAGTVVTNTNFAVTNGPVPVVPVTTATISGLVYVDRDRNNALDTADGVRISGVTVKLVQGVSCDSGTVLQTTTTASDGSYSFANVKVGESYLICETQPAGYGNGNAKGTPGSNSIAITSLPVGGSNDNNFGELLGSISGLVYLDSNSNGRRNTGEPGIAGVTVTLTGTDINGLSVSRSAVTDPAGQYRFEGLLAAGPGGYKVTEQTEQPNAPGTQNPTLNGTTAAGTIAGVTSGSATAVAVLPSAVSGIALPAGADSVDNNFAEVTSALVPDMVVTKTANKAIFTEGFASVYSLKVKNVGTAATTGVYTVVDRLPPTPLPAKWRIEAAAGPGWTCTISTDRQQVSCDGSQLLQAGQENPSPIQLTVNIAQGASAFSPLRNLVSVSGGGEPQDKAPQPSELSAPKACASQAEFNACQLATAVQVAVGLSGSVWIDGGSKGLLDAGDKRLPGWIVEIYDASSGKTLTDLVRGGMPSRTTTTGSDGSYQVCGLEPGSAYRVLFRDPASRIAFPGVVTNEGGRTTGSEYFSQVKTLEGFQVLQVTLPQAATGANPAACNVTAPEQSLPLDPNGVVYDSQTRAAVPGSVVTLVPVGSCPGYDPKLHIINYETYAKDAAGNPSLTTGSDGFYKFLLSGDPTAPKSCQFRIDVKEPVGYAPPPSTVILPTDRLVTPIGPGIFNVQPQKTAPVESQGTRYHFELLLGLNHQEVFNNHIPLDPLRAGRLVLTKQGDRRLAEVGDTVLYSITVRLLEGAAVAQATVRDRLPAGFTLVPGTVRVNNVPAPNPLGGRGPVLGFNLGPLQPNVEARVTYRVRVGVGAVQGDGINRAQAHTCQAVASCLNPLSLVPITGAVASNESQHKVEVSGGVFTDQACVLGKVFVDCNNNHVQDSEELGIPGVRLYFENGRSVVTDSEGKYSYCGLTPRSHVLAVDATTLPRGSRLTTTSNRNLGDANSLFIDLKNGELHRADFAEGSCSNPVMEQVKARRAQGEVRSVETEKSSGPALQFQSKPLSVPKQGTDSANQPLVLPRQGGSDAR